MIHYEPTNYGFDYGSAKVTRLFSDCKKGLVVVGIESKKQELQIYVTKTGKIRVFSKNGELK
jgi:hypothetical protein